MKKTEAPGAARRTTAGTALVRTVIARTAIPALLLLAALSVFAQTEGRRRLDLFGGITDPEGTMRFSLEGGGTALRVSGATGGYFGGTAGYILVSPENLPLSGAKRLILVISGIKDTDRYDMQKLLKLELNDQPQPAISPGMKNYNDPAYINARDGEAVFDISALTDIRKLNLVFFNCAITDVKIEVFYE
jgi:hypothetical protein